LARQLYSAAVSTKGRIIIGGIVATTTRFLGIKPNPEDRISGSEWLDQAAFEIVNFCKVEAGRLCWIYAGKGTGFCHFPMLIELPYFTRLTFIGCLLMTRLFNQHSIIEPFILVK